MKYITFFSLIFLFNLSTAQEPTSLFEKTFSSNILTAADIGNLQANSSFIVGKINPLALSAQNLKFNSHDGAEIILNKIKFEKQGNASIWIGKIQNNNIGNSYISIVNDVVWGKIEKNDGKQFMIRPLFSNPNFVIMYETHMGYQNEDCDDEEDLIIDTHPDSGEGRYEYVEFDSTDVCDPTSVCINDIVDVLVVYNGTAKMNLGGSDSAVEAAIGLAMTEMNIINFNSGNETKIFNLVSAEEINYDESGSFSTDLNRLRVEEDGFMDDVLDLRDEFYADVVSLIVGSGGCGLGNVNINSVQYESQAGFSVCSSSCMTGNKTLAHEIGHNMGFRHDRYAYNPEPAVVCSEAWGWVNPGAFGGSNNQKWRTVMAYNNECSDQGFNCFRINNWSNPNVDYNSESTGSAIGNPDEANNSGILDRAFCQVGDFREAPFCSDCEIIQQCESYNNLTNLGPGNTTDIQFITSIPELSISGADAQVCIYYYGDHNNSAEQFNILDENDNLLGTTIESFDCDIPNRVCFNIEPGTFNTWIADGQVNITLDPITANINPNLCSANRACAELIIPNTLSNQQFENVQTQIKLYPNPARNIVQISTDEIIENVLVYSITGQLIKEHQGSNAIDISELSNGIYILKFHTHNTIITKKIIKE